MCIGRPLVSKLAASLFVLTLLYPCCYLLSMRYFTKVSPRLPARLSSGHVITFNPVIADSLGVYATSDDKEIEALAAVSNTGRGGIGEIDQEKYDELLKKKLTLSEQSEPQSKILSKQTSGEITDPAFLAQRLLSQLAAPAAAKPVEPAPASAPVAPVAEAPPPDFAPQVKVGKKK